MRVAFIGFGEAAQAIAAGLSDEGLSDMAAWDILFAGDSGQALRDAAATIGVRVASSAADATRDSELVISGVTAASSLDAARSVAAHLKEKFFLDINSVSPGRKQATAKALGDARYVDVAVMGPIHPARHQTPMLIAGPHAETAAPILHSLGMKAAIAGAEIGAAAAIKMVRSVMVKGMEALTYECFVAAARAGVEQQVLTSLAKSFPGTDWAKTVEYNMERMATHGARRAAEMEEVADTLRELGIEPLMTSATVNRQREMALLGKKDSVRAAIDQGYGSLLRAVSAEAKARRN